jgi:UDP-N-acetylmuramyl pentapeptide phosphotransferase/UDP-N-acetylglucosamine-1-phosphate transferase
MSGYIALGLATFLVSYLGIMAMLKWPRRDHILDIPNARSSHSEPTPSGGGLVIITVAIGALLLLGLFGILIWSGPLLAYIAGAGIVGTISFLDDIRNLSYRSRILIQSIAAILIIVSGIYLSSLSLPVVGNINVSWLGIPLTFVFIIGLTNAYNFMDGIDGLAGLQAVIASFFLLFLAWLVNAELLSVTGLLIGASTLGFLVHNWSPAKIFMGDIGSTFLGFSFAVLILMLNDQDTQFFFLGVLALWPFIFDTTYTFLRRLMRGENVFEAHRSHLYQKLVDQGYSQSSTTLFYGLLSFVGILLGLAWYYGFLNLGVLVLITALALALVAFSERKVTNVVEN